jgi:hypothetical protein
MSDGNDTRSNSLADVTAASSLAQWAPCGGISESPEGRLPLRCRRVRPYACVALGLKLLLVSQDILNPLFQAIQIPFALVANDRAQ